MPRKVEHTRIELVSELDCCPEGNGNSKIRTCDLTLIRGVLLPAELCFLVKGGDVCLRLTTGRLMLKQVSLFYDAAEGIPHLMQLSLLHPYSASF